MTCWYYHSKFDHLIYYLKSILKFIIMVDLISLRHGNYHLISSFYFKEIFLNFILIYSLINCCFQLELIHFLLTFYSFIELVLDFFQEAALFLRISILLVCHKFFDCLGNFLFDFAIHFKNHFRNFKHFEWLFDLLIYYFSLFCPHCQYVYPLEQRRELWKKILWGLFDFAWWWYLPQEKRLFISCSQVPSLCYDL